MMSTIIASQNTSNRGETPNSANSVNVNANESQYPLIIALENSDASYRTLLSQYTSLYSQYIDAQAANKNAELGQKEQMLKQTVDSMKLELDKMNNLLNEAYNDGLTNQKLSSEASNALGLQSSLIDMRMKQYQEARNTLAHLIGEEETSRQTVSRNRYIYTVYFIFAIALCVSIIFMMLGGSLPFGILVILLIIGVFLGWEFYKSWIARIGNNINLNFGAMNVKGVFRIVT